MILQPKQPLTSHIMLEPTLIPNFPPLSPMRVLLFFSTLHGLNISTLTRTLFHSSISLFFPLHAHCMLKSPIFESRRVSKTARPTLNQQTLTITQSTLFSLKRYPMICDSLSNSQTRFRPLTQMMTQTCSFTIMGKTMTGPNSTSM